MTLVINQCDGCQKGLPVLISKFGGKFHRDGNYLINCTANRYERSVNKE